VHAMRNGQAAHHLPEPAYHHFIGMGSGHSIARCWRETPRPVGGTATDEVLRHGLAPLTASGRMFMHPGPLRQHAIMPRVGRPIHVHGSMICGCTGCRPPASGAAPAQLETARRRAGCRGDGRAGLRRRRDLRRTVLPRAAAGGSGGSGGVRLAAGGGRGSGSAAPARDRRRPGSWARSSAAGTCDRSSCARAPPSCPMAPELRRLRVRSGRPPSRLRRPRRRSRAPRPDRAVRRLDRPVRTPVRKILTGPAT
jgi:hypothetical protein